MSKIVRFVDTDKANLSSVPVRAGNLIYVKDSLEQFFDVDGSTRIQLTDVIFLDDDTDRTLILAPVPYKLYFVKETYKFWMADQEFDWTCINPDIANATNSTAGLMSATDKAKLDGIEDGANNYTHPENHPASMITGLSTVATSGSYTDLSNTPTIPNLNGIVYNIESVDYTATEAVLNFSELTAENVVEESELPINSASATTAGLMSAADKVKLNGIDENANNYVHPESGVTGGTYNSVTVDANGHVTAATNVPYSDISAVNADGNFSKDLVPTSNNTVDLGSETARLSAVYATSVDAGAGTFSSDVTIQGNLTVNGDTVTVNAETVLAKDNMIELNNGETGAGVTAGQSGITIDRGTQAPYYIVFDESDDLFKVGMEGDLEILATRPYVDDALNDKLDVNGTASAAEKVVDGDWSMAVEGGNLVFKYGGTTVATLNTVGKLSVAEIAEEY